MNKRLEEQKQPAFPVSEIGERIKRMFEETDPECETCCERSCTCWHFTDQELERLVLRAVELARGIE